MAYTREERVALHKKQETKQVITGQPVIAELAENVPVVRSTPDGVAIFVRFNNKMYKTALTIVEV